MIRNTLIALAVFALSATAVYAQPALGPDCPAGTIIAAGSAAAAGKVTMGNPIGSQTGTCTLTFGTSHLRACEAINETNGGGFPVPEGGKTPNLTDMVIGSQDGWGTGDVVSWQCTNF